MSTYNKVTFTAVDTTLLTAITENGTTFAQTSGAGGNLEVKDNRVFNSVADQQAGAIASGSPPMAHRFAAKMVRKSADASHIAMITLASTAGLGSGYELLLSQTGLTLFNRVYGASYDADDGFPGMAALPNLILVIDVTDDGGNPHIAVWRNGVLSDIDVTIAGGTTSGKDGLGGQNPVSTDITGIHCECMLSFAGITISPDVSELNINSVGVVTITSSESALYTEFAPTAAMFQLSGGTGASITAVNVVDDSTVELTISAGSAEDTLVIRDPVTLQTISLDVIVPPLVAPTLTIDTVGSTTARTTWGSATGGAGGYSYALHRSTASGFTPNSGNRIQAGATSPYNNFQLTPDTDWYWKLVVTDALGNTATSAEATAHTAEAEPLAEGTLSLVSVGSTSIAVQAVDATGGIPPYLTEWIVVLTGVDPATGTPIPGADTVTPPPFTGLTPETIYDVYCRWTDSAAETVYSAVLTIETLAENPPQPAYFGSTGLTIYAHILDEGGRVATGNLAAGAFVDRADNWAEYVKTTSDPNDLGEYRMIFPNWIPAGSYDVVFYQQADVDPASSDTRVGAASWPWTGSRVGYAVAVDQQIIEDAVSAAIATAGLAVPGDAMTLTSGERTAIADEVEAQIIDDSDAEKVLEAIVNKINAMTDLDALTLAAIASAIRTELATELARIDVATSSRPSASSIATQVRTELTTELGRLDAAVSSRAATGAAMTLTSGERTSVADAVLTRDYSAITGTIAKYSLYSIFCMIQTWAKSLSPKQFTARKPDGSTQYTATYIDDSNGNVTSVTPD